MVALVPGEEEKEVFSDEEGGCGGSICWPSCCNDFGMNTVGRNKRSREPGFSSLSKTVLKLGSF